MPEIKLMRGYPASGKTTLAKEWVADRSRWRARVSRDDLRESLFGLQGRLIHEQEQTISAVQQAQVRALVEAGLSVVVDDMNLRLAFARNWADLAAELGVEFTVQDVPTPMEECLLRDWSRFNMGQRHVGQDAIKDIAQRFPISRWPEVKPRDKAQHAWTPYEPPVVEHPLDLFLKPIYLVDIDGTLAKKRMGPNERGWHDYARVGEDLPNRGVINFVLDLAVETEIVFMSGRKQFCDTLTRRWLKDYVGEWTVASPLFMRANDDNRSDDIVKHELFHEHIQGKYDVRGVIDDRDRVVAMWRAIGLTVAQIDYGNF